MSFRRGNIQLSAQCGSKRLFDQINPSCARFHCRLNHRAFFHLRNAAGNTDDHTRLHHRIFYHLANHFRQHFRRQLVVGNYTVLQRMNCDNVTRRSAQHISGSGTDLKHLTGVFIQRNHRRLTQNNALACRVDQNIGGTEIDTKIL